MLDTTNTHKLQEQSGMEQVVDDSGIQIDDSDNRNDRTVRQGEYESEQEQTSMNKVESNDET